MIYPFFKSLGDRLFGFLLSVLCLPFVGIIAVLVRLKLGRPIFFRQVRPGHWSKPFTLYKFRTMTEGRDESGELLPDKQRMTPFGALLRRMSLDELPQLFNIIKGDLSFIGPRPLLMEYLPLYSEAQARRQEVKPGITGWAQVNGRNAISHEEKFRLDVWYVDHQSLWLDLKIAWMTLQKVVSGENIFAEGHVTMPKFTGNSSSEGENHG